jgi:serine/threonine-protein kinase
MAMGRARIIEAGVSGMHLRHDKLAAGSYPGRMERAEVFGKYELIRPLATGGMAEVFLASQVGPGGVTREVVVKRVLPQLSSAGEFVSMFLDEARLAVRLSHPNVIQVFDFGKLDGSYFLVLELLDGADVDTLLRLTEQRGQPVPERIAALIAAQACDGLQYVHSLAGPDGRPLHVIHRDVSPSNLFVTYQGTVKLLDFGIAKAESNLSQTQAGQTKGKIAYMAPEQLLHEPLDPRSDVFALGVVFWELLAGLGLFVRPDVGAMMRAVLVEPIPLPSSKRPGISPQLEAVAMRAISRDPALRYGSAAEMRAELDKFLGGLPFVPAADALQGYLRELMAFDPSRKITDRTVPVSFTDPTVVPPKSPIVAGADLEPTTVQPDPTAPPGASPFEPSTVRERPNAPALRAVDPPLEPTVLSLDPTADAPAVTLAPPWKRWLPAALLLPLVFLVGLGIRLLPSGQTSAPVQPPVPAPAVTAPTPVSHPPPSLSPVPRPPTVRESPRPAVDHPRAARLHVSEDASAKQVARMFAELGASVGVLKVGCAPASCHVFIDGETVGSVPPAKLVYLPSGHHVIKAIDLRSGKERTSSVNIRAGKQVAHTVRF